MDVEFLKLWFGNVNKVPGRIKADTAAGVAADFSAMREQALVESLNNIWGGSSKAGRATLLALD